jgi:hypothetical protein
MPQHRHLARLNDLPAAPLKTPLRWIIGKPYGINGGTAAVIVLIALQYITGVEKFRINHRYVATILYCGIYTYARSRSNPR